MCKYTPTTEEVRARYSADEFGNSAGLSDPCPEFDRWLAEHDRQVKAEAWEEGWDAGLQHWWHGLPMHGEHKTDNPYREETE